MLELQPATNGHRSGTRHFGLALAGGGPLGAFYEIGALHGGELGNAPLGDGELRGLGGADARGAERGHATDDRHVVLAVEAVAGLRARGLGHTIAALPGAQRGRRYAGEIGDRLNPVARDRGHATRR